MRRLPTPFLVAAFAAAMSIAGLLVLSGPPASARSGDTPAATAVRAVIDGQTQPVGSVIPADFATVMGYRPSVLEDRLVDRLGDCSSVVPLPAEFAPACAEHDLGYDLLRYAALTGEPLDGWARDEIDTRFGARMREACAQRPSGPGRTSCLMSADIAVTAVRLNTVRQLHGVPEETTASVAVTVAAALTALSVLALLVLRRGRS